MDADKEGLGDYDDTHLECRDLRHAWKVIGYYREDGEIRRQLQCMRCETYGTDRWTAKAERKHRRYAYAEGYLIQHGRKLKPIDFRREVLSRVQVFENEEQMMASLFSSRERRRQRKAQ